MKRRKSILVLVSMILILTAGVAGTFAFLVAGTDPVENTFNPTKVPPVVVEEFESGVKSDVKIKNSGTTDAYIRASVVATWVKTDSEGKVTSVYGQKPVEGTDYEMEWKLSDGWEQGPDGYYYWTDIVPAEDGKNLTGVLFTDCKLKEGVSAPEDGYVLSVEIIAQSIQAAGTEYASGRHPVEIEWNTGVEKVNEDGSLSIRES